MRPWRPAPGYSTRGDRDVEQVVEEDAVHDEAVLGAEVPSDNEQRGPADSPHFLSSKDSIGHLPRDVRRSWTSGRWSSRRVSSLGTALVMSSLHQPRGRDKVLQESTVRRGGWHAAGQ